MSECEHPDIGVALRLCRECACLRGKSRPGAFEITGLPAGSAASSSGKAAGTVLTVLCKHETISELKVPFTLKRRRNDEQQNLASMWANPNTDCKAVAVMSDGNREKARSKGQVTRA